MALLKVYLAGGAFEVDYRQFSKKEFGHKMQLIDPMEENGALIDVINRKIILSKTGEEVVKTDKSLIESSDILVAYINKYSAGTMMEILHAWVHGIPTYLIVTPNNDFENDIWLKYHSVKIFFKIDECFNYILDQMKYM